MTKYNLFANRTSIQGASQALEDGVTLAVVLQLGGKGDVPTSVRAWEGLRYARVRRAQRIGETTRNMWHNAAPDARGASLELPRPEWLLGFDAEKDMYESFGGAVDRIKREGYKLPSLLGRKTVEQNP